MPAEGRPAWRTLDGENPGSVGLGFLLLCLIHRKVCSVNKTPSREDELIARAMEVKERAAAPYSGFAVGAALLAADGTIYTGCNVESSSYGLTICAERVALGKAISEGRRQFTALAIVTDLEDFCPPCGACRQLLWDYAPQLEIIVATRSGRRRRYQLRELFPEAFDNHFLRQR